MEIKASNFTRKGFKRQSIIRLVSLFLILILANFIASYIIFRIDLTKENRYSLSELSKKTITELNDIIYLKVYLDGSLPHGFNRLKNTIREMLDEFRVYGNDNIQYEFINLSEIKDKKNRDEIYRQLYMKGLVPTNLQVKEDDGNTSQQVIWPGAIMSFKTEEIAINFLKNSVQLTPEQNLNASIEEIEYNLTSSIKKLNREFGHRIAFVEGYGEFSEIEVADFTRSLNEFYNVERVRLEGKINALSERVEDSTGFIVHNKYDLIIIAGSDSTYTDRDLYMIDQFIMYGGKALFLTDVVEASIDSLAYKNEVLAFIKNLNLDKMIFKYGARINPDLLQDVQCAVIPVNTSAPNTQPQFKPFPWVFFPMIVPTTEHPITRNVNMIKTQFVSSIDTVGENANIHKTILLTTSNQTKVLNAPVRVSLAIIREKLNPSHFKYSQRAVAVLLQGKFTSFFENRLTPAMYDAREIAFKGESLPTKVIVVSDADIIKNHVKSVGYNKEALPLGYDRFTGETYGNKDLLMNIVNYLLDDSGLMELRSRVIKLRLLDRAKLESSATTWQIINIVIPVLLVLISGILFMAIRKRKYIKPLK